MALFISIMQSKAKLVAQRGEVDQPAKDAQDKLNEYVKENLPGLASRDLYTLGQSMQGLDIQHPPDQRESDRSFAEQSWRRGTGRSLPVLPRGNGSAASFR